MTSDFIDDILNEWERAGGIYSQAAKLVRKDIEQKRNGSVPLNDPIRQTLEWRREHV